MGLTEGVWVLIEHQSGKLRDGSLELVGEGRKVADKMNEGLTAVILGNTLDEQAGLLAQFGAERILSIEHPALSEYSVEIYSQVLSDVIEKQSPSVVLLMDSVNGADLASRVAARLEAGLVTSCDRVDVSGEKLLLQTKPVYEGKASVTLVCPSARPQMATISLDALELKSPDTTRTAEVVSLKVSTELEKQQTRTVGFIKGDPKIIDLREAEIIVDGGRGLGSREGFKLIEELAEVIGGSVAASRMAVDEGWATIDRQIGQTGKTVRPKLVIACGVSGAFQHTMGMKDSKTIVAINLDRKAPIFKVADVAVVGDVLKVLPPLTAQLRQVLAEHSKPSVDEVLNIFRDSGSGLGGSR